ncbi:tRNA uridine-5-carboxymethylaminomethyl(34) synthesis GTPase MnmE [Caldichromatium japonicum]|uniref:tRNA modification GTPase MnmE n=1 Tax=Caldichromatium japonicum TaxID=2699430 RepID=A0A6G7VGL1_9GAMM|nr:tRNA uridine-5-carboxymethylaminomethyl(34) synthesis GTPase MnmE [Caldichromatium japonicum]QIK39016.1 tRNA uridine-5-carboxymethylaminomethyl(34) synthesis GTPase MnmE [Caldichromatium japonicum]
MGLRAGDTIAAIATPSGVGGVGIIRVSGPAVRQIAEALIGRLPRPRYATLSTFSAADGSPIDQGLALYFPAPHSYTGEDVLELHGHGGPVVMDLLLHRCLEFGARLARPGEFTERAFLNGKLDLTQAEAVADLIESSTALAARLAARSLQGVFSQHIQALVEGLIELRVHLEATLDFPDEELDLADERAQVADGLSALIAQLDRLLAEAYEGQRIREGLNVAIAGAPNVGKSSLLNALCGSEAAIVTDIPGTTRDLLRFDIQIEGLPIHIIDTAGLRHTQDPVEREGVRRAQEAVQQADLVLWVYDAARGLDEGVCPSLAPRVPLIRVRNKIDLLGESPGIKAEGEEVEVALSVKTGGGLELLKAQIKHQVGLSPHPEGAFSARRRHLDALRRAKGSLLAASEHLAAGQSPELVAEELRAAQQSLGEITGKFSSEDLLDRIFASFCIGK